jgi:hypothetical protein
LIGIPNFAIEKDGGNGLRETKIRLLRDTTLRVRLSVPKGTPTPLAASGTQYLLMVRELEWPPNGTVMWCGPVSKLRGNNAVELRAVAHECDPLEEHRVFALRYDASTMQALSRGR